MLNPCSKNLCENGNCINSGLSYKCVCRDGYTGQYCDKALHPCKQSKCAKGGICKTTEDGQSYTCKCKRGFRGEYCDYPESSPCPCDNGKCVWTANSYRCECYLGSYGPRCDKDRCRPNPCENGGTCRLPLLWVFSTSVECDCLEGFVGDFCQIKLDPCRSSRCIHGNCIPSANSYRCDCWSGYSGKYCEREFDPCQLLPCKHGQCIETGNFHQCDCLAGYSGQHCDIEINPCVPNPCNKGYCSRDVIPYRCNCWTGYTGEHCDREIDPCLPSPCNKGECVRYGNSYRCNCYTGYTGQHCDTAAEVYVCWPNPCKNGGTCAMVDDRNFICICPEGYAGTYCELTVSPRTNFCSVIQCQNGGICDGIAQICTCLPGYSGNLCQIHTNNLKMETSSICSPNPCLHGKCKETNNNYRCYCSIGYYGDTCQLSLYPLQWTPCTRTCGGGTRYRSELCKFGNVVDCPRVYEDCNTHDCPKITCPWNSKHRFNSTSECCSKTNGKNCIKTTDDNNMFTHLIIGGVTSKPKDWPWMAALYLQNKGKFVCGGSIVGKSWVLTAAHCVDKQNPSNVLVLVGSRHHTQLDAGHRWIGASRIFLHPTYDGTIGDVALIKLHFQLEYTDNIRPICLPNGEKVETDTKCFAPGWGIANREDIPIEKSSASLQHAGLRILPRDVCAQGYKNSPYYRAVTDNVICSGLLSGNKDTCLGDSGGPLACQRKASCDWYIAGVTSFGAVECGSKNVPTGFMDIVHYEAWIKQTIYKN
uniref:hyaluronan-binding protein 2-like n=1 Tax=Styela clava TaxID=7725 RepID=UPI00193AA3ED|nr:hyaluronan-binding protein 2-like [Styela clava]